MENAREYSQLGFTDDFMFCKVLSTNPDLCKELLELIIGLKVRDIAYINDQSTVKITKDSKGVRFDVYIEDNEDVIYDVEMQTTSNKNLPKRTRYYQGMIDLHVIESGDDYQKLKKTYIIFICTFDPFGEGLPVYTFHNTCKEMPELLLNDQSIKVFLNPTSNCENVSDNLKNFLRFIATQEPNDDFTEKLNHQVNVAKNNKKWEVEYMTLLMRDRENREKGIEIGERKLAELIDKPYSLDRKDDVSKVTSDKAYRESLYKEFNITD